MVPMDFSLARFNHQLWKMRLRSFLDGKDGVSEAELLSHTQCDLGKWLYDYALAKHADVAEMQQLEKVHAQLHSQVAQIVRFRNGGHLDQAKQEYAGLVPLSEEIVRLLGVIEERVKAKP